MDLGGAPQWVLKAHSSDQVAHLLGDPRSATRRTRLPSPVSGKTHAMGWRRMRRYGELSSGVERSSPRQFFPDYTIAMRGYDFREGQRRPHRIGARPRRTSSPLLPNL